MATPNSENSLPGQKRAQYEYYLIYQEYCGRLQIVCLNERLLLKWVWTYEKHEDCSIDQKDFAGDCYAENRRYMASEGNKIQRKETLNRHIPYNNVDRVACHYF